jgi:Ca2+-binding RTX toxin-like protein
VATYFFETITAAQALAFNGAADTLVFTSALQSAADERLIFNAGGTITVLSNLEGHSVTFGPGLAGAAQIIFPDSSQMLVGSAGGDVLTGGAHGDGLFGGFGDDTLNGGPGDDALQGGPGADVLTGGAGRNLFIVSAGESPPVTGQMDTITDWSSGDALTFFRGPTVPSSYVESTAADFASAKTFANAQIAGGTVEYVAMQVGGDVIVFADSHGDHGVAEDAVILAGRTLADIDASNITTTALFPGASPPPPPASPPPPVFPPPPPVSPPVGPAHGVTAVIGGELDTAQLTNLEQNGVATFSPTALTLQAGGSSITLTGFGFTIDADENLTGGTLTGIDFTIVGGPHAHIAGLSTPVVTLVDALDQQTSAQFFGAIFSGDDSIVGDSAVNTIHGYSGDDTIQGLGGTAFLYGDDGADSLVGGAGADHLVGGPGGDTLTGGAGANVFEIQPGDSPSSLAASGHLEGLDHITDWSSSDFIEFSGGPASSANGYEEVTASTFEQARGIAITDRVSSGIGYVAAQVGSDVIVFGEQTLEAVVLTGRTLADISQANVGADVGAPASPPAPPPAGGAHTGATVDLYDGVDMGTFQESSLADAVATRSSTLEHLTFAGGAAQMSITGVGLTYDSNGVLSGGTVTGVEITSPSGHFVLTGAHTDGSILGQAYLTNNAELSISNLLAGDDVITVRGTQTPGADTSFTALGYGGNDLMVGGGSASTLMGGDGNDTVQAGSAATSYLRGEAGDDSISGGSGFDDINGNQGNDTASGGAGDDWVVGGKDNDLLFGDDGDDIVWGNLGNDTLDGGAGNDQVRGGQGDDSISGGAGDDYISGDRGNDTETGGPGADIFHSFSGAGIDRVLDFNAAEGDRVMLDPGTSYTVSQVGADTVVDMGNGDQVILVGVQLSTLPAGWIFLG